MKESLKMCVKDLGDVYMFDMIVDVVDAGYDFKDTNPAKFDVSVCYNDTFANQISRQPLVMIHVSHSLNMVSLFSILPTEGV